MSVPVVISGNDVVLGYYPKQLIEMLDLDVTVDLGSSTEWLADKYDRILQAAIRVTKQLTEDQLEVGVTWRPQTVRQHMVHVLSFPELALNSHLTGSMTTEDMRNHGQNVASIKTIDEICLYGEKVKLSIHEFLGQKNSAGLDRVVEAHYGGEVTVLELLNIILRHSTHLLKQMYWFMDESLQVKPISPATESDLEGIATPTELI